MENNFEKIFVKENFERMFDLVWYEYPLTTLFYNKFNDEYYLFDWCSHTKNHNTWIVLQIELKDLYKFVTKEISFLKLHHISSNYGAICSVDENFEWKFEQVLISNLHESYLPTDEYMFDKSDCPKYDELLEFFNENSIYDKTLSNEI